MPLDIQKVLGSVFDPVQRNRSRNGVVDFIPSNGRVEVFQPSEGRFNQAKSIEIFGNILRKNTMFTKLRTMFGPEDLTESTIPSVFYHATPNNVAENCLRSDAYVTISENGDDKVVKVKGVLASMTDSYLSMTSTISGLAAHIHYKFKK